MTTGRSLRVGEAVLGGGVLALGLFVAFETSQMQVAASHAAVGPRLFPFLIAGGLILVGGGTPAQAFFGHVAHEGGFELDWLAVAAGLGRAHRPDAAARMGGLDRRRHHPVRAHRPRLREPQARGRCRLGVGWRH